MSNLSTSYMGIELANPVVVASSTLSANVDTIRSLEEAGAGAVVVRSLFEEQIHFEVAQMEDALAVEAEAHAEALSYLPMLEHAGAREHLMWVEKTRDSVKVPLIGSVNAASSGRWVDYAKQLTETGIDALELNVYAVPSDMAATAADVEQRLYETFEAVREVVDIPIAVKLSPFYSSVGNVVSELQARGAAAVVLFNRFLQPDIDIDAEKPLRNVSSSRQDDMRLPLRWIALLYGRVDLDLVANTGVQQGADVVKCILAGAGAVQVAGALYAHGPGHIATMLEDLTRWMEAKGYTSLDDFRGKVSQKDAGDQRFNFERAQYVGFILSQQA